MARLAISVTGREDASRQLRVVMAQTVRRRLEERAVPEFLREARAQADAKVGRQKDKYVHPDGYVQNRREPGPHYHDMFEAEVLPGDTFPLTVVGKNTHQAANIVEEGRVGGYVVEAKRKKTLMYPGVDVTKKFPTSATVGRPVSGKFIVRDALKIAVRRASR